MEETELRNNTGFDMLPCEERQIHIVASCPSVLCRQISCALTLGAMLPLLLPYCAKPPACRFRYIEGCSQCGGCDIGDAYRLAGQFALRPMTIQNYEMLEERLQQIRINGIGVFIGLCCTAFFLKHQQDFERIGVPGRLIGLDSSTCYDLGKEDEAHHGLFEHQTRLKLDLLSRVLIKAKKDSIPKAFEQ